MPPLAVCVDAFPRHFEHQAEEREAAGEQWQETGLVSTRSGGTLIPLGT